MFIGGDFMNYVLITGATSGIGYELAKLFVCSGYGVVLVASSKERLQSTKERLEAINAVPVYTFVQDLCLLGAAQKLHSKIKEQEIPISILINNAGFGLVGPTVDIDLLEDQRMLIINIINLVELTKLFMPDMLQYQKGKILNVSSIGAFQPGPYTSTYFASKAFVLNYTRAIRYEAKSRGVQISVLCPGATKTNFFNREGTSTPSRAMAAEKVAAIAYRGLMNGKEIIIPGLKNRLLQLFPLKIKMISVAKMKS